MTALTLRDVRKSYGVVEVINGSTWTSHRASAWCLSVHPGTAWSRR
ncbi:MAG: hypothetical protein WCS20_03040 [Alphaproteobacteria bacterium]